MYQGVPTWGNLIPLATHGTPSWGLCRGQLYFVRPRQLPNGKWYYPSLHHVLCATCLHTVVEYVGVRCRGVMKKTKDRPVLELLQQAQQQRGLPPRQYWHKLPMFMEMDAAAFGDSVGRDNPGAGARASGAREGEARPL